MALAEKKGDVYRMVVAATLANVPAFVYGLSFGWMSPMGPLLQSARTPSSAPLSDAVVAWMAGFLSLGASLSTPLFGFAADRFGRKPALILISLVFAVSWSIKLVSAEAGPLIAARACAGLAAGGTYLVIPIYVREISEDTIRGALGSIMMFAANLGVIVVYGLGVVLSYHQSLWLYLALPLLHALFFCCMPESPAYCVMKNRPEEAARTIAWLRKLEVSDAIVLQEVAQLQKDELEARATPPLTVRSIVGNKGLFRAVRMAFIIVTTETVSGCFAVIQYSALIFYRAGTAWRPEYLALFVGAMQLLGSIVSIYAVERCGRKVSGFFAVIQYSALIFYRAGTAWRPEYLALFVGAMQLLGSIVSIYAVERCGRKVSGFFAVIQYSALIFYRAGTAWRPEYLALFVGAMQLLGSIVSIYAVERCGRKPLLSTSTLVISGSMCTLAVWFALVARGASPPGWLPVAAVCLCIFSYGAGLASVPFVIVAEIFSFQVRARLSGWVLSASWLISTLTVTFFVPVANAFGDQTVFSVFTAITLSGGVYVALCVPETRNKPLADIQLELEGQKPRNNNIFTLDSS